MKPKSRKKLLALLLIATGLFIYLRVHMKEKENLASLTNYNIEEIRILKKDRTLKLIIKNKPIKTYRVALGFNPTGHKIKEGDGKTPEGTYYVERKKANSAFHKALKISYPSEQDKRKARKIGVNPGNNIMIHGIKNGLEFVGKAHTLLDWTKGCIAVTNEEMDEIYDAVKIGTKVEILP